MSIGLRRAGGIVGVVGGIGLAAWLVFGAPHDWDGGMRLLRHGLALVSLGAINGGAWLMFSGGQDGASDVVAG
ncbi:hypothetical protein [Streptomyces neyagawaensis]|uniref:hypothetical protein n=1 Tax=Streptomyces neyagawaensis TaxID=42238 RepID=UPI00201CCFB5|nr:hypothetical protein [Streptomyces neyagawaensis]MCL6734251.1 hypothetical protein [Streptomyces neyagawaensis]MDE1681881.1 hypothetical protein [Streptomyces neyagawaensis]